VKRGAPYPLRKVLSYPKSDLVSEAELLVAMDAYIKCRSSRMAVCMIRALEAVKKRGAK